MSAKAGFWLLLAFAFVELIVAAMAGIPTAPGPYIAGLAVLGVLRGWEKVN